MAVERPRGVITIVVDADGQTSHSFLGPFDEATAAIILHQVAEDLADYSEQAAPGPGLAGRRGTSHNRMSRRENG